VEEKTPVQKAMEDWTPESDEIYYYPCFDGNRPELYSYFYWGDSLIDKRVKNTLGIFKTKEEAQARAKEILELIKK
ncbi:MAG: hypothetical protein KDH96_13670, partial [Candidatus Riesia sp.]|nr:hypothetical protein [Candidatus Riesia sp.]